MFSRYKKSTDSAPKKVPSAARALPQPPAEQASAPAPQQPQVTPAKPTSLRRPQQAAEYAADAGDAAVAQDEDRSRDADENAAGQRGPGREMRPGDDHDVLPLPFLQYSV